MDPVSKQIYHSQFNPMPEVKGFADKLIELQALDDQTIIDSLNYFKSELPKIKQFYDNFGLQSKNIFALSTVDQGEDKKVQ